MNVKIRNPRSASLTEKWQDSVFLIATNLARIASGLELKTQRLDDGTVIHYYDNNRQGRETLVLVHGFNADKSHWLPMALHLSRYRIIIPDLGGHGQSDYDANLTYDIPLYASQLQQLLTGITTTPFHLLGNSMGGWIAAYFAYRYPSAVQSLALMNACGVHCPVTSPFFAALAEGKNPFFYSSWREFEALLNIAVANPRGIPRSILSVNYRHGVARLGLARKLFADITNHDQTFLEPGQMLDRLLPDIRQPTFILWGDRDGIMDPSMASVFDRRIPQSETIIMTRVGHTPMLEQPGKSARLYKNFLRQHI